MAGAGFEIGFAVRDSFHLDLVGGGLWVTVLLRVCFPICHLTDGELEGQGKVYVVNVSVGLS